VLKDRKKIQRTVINVRTHGHLLSIAEQQTRTFAKGDKVIKPDRSLNIQNGTTAQVVNIDPFTKNIRVKTDQKRTLTVNLKNYPYRDYAHALTNYKVQGKTADHVFVCLRYSPSQ